MYNSYHFVLYGNTINTEKEANGCKKIKKIILTGKVD